MSARSGVSASCGSSLCDSGCVIWILGSRSKSSRRLRRKLRMPALSRTGACGKSSATARMTRTTRTTRTIETRTTRMTRSGDSAPSSPSSESSGSAANVRDGLGALVGRGDVDGPGVGGSTGDFEYVGSALGVSVWTSWTCVSLENVAASTISEAQTASTARRRPPCEAAARLMAARWSSAQAPETIFCAIEALNSSANVFADRPAARSTTSAA
mmetsp:Transcript_824/g.2624  ORF Transcript_824/g.2624 Transcript_824/m.2624 type:complete len:214 (+) Transcript_824:238-879(+)